MKKIREDILKALRGCNRKKKIEKKEVSEKSVVNMPCTDKGRQWAPVAPSNKQNFKIPPKLSKFQKENKKNKLATCM